MTNHAETSPNLEILSVAESDAYIRAANTVLYEDGALIRGVNHPDPSPYRDDFPRAFHKTHVETYDPEDIVSGGIRFETTVTRDETSTSTYIGQFVGAEWQHDRQVVRSFHIGTKEPMYVITKWPKNTKPGDDMLEIGVKTEAGKLTAEALFQTMATDFKAQLDEKLADRPELLAKIESLARELPEPLPGLHSVKTRRNRFLGRIAGSKR